MCEELTPNVPLVSGWPKSVKSAILHVISMAHYAMVAARGWAANSVNTRVRVWSQNPTVGRKWSVSARIETTTARVKPMLKELRDQRHA